MSAVGFFTHVVPVYPSWGRVLTPHKCSHRGISQPSTTVGHHFSSSPVRLKRNKIDDIYNPYARKTSRMVTFALSSITSVNNEEGSTQRQNEKDTDSKRRSMLIPAPDTQESTPFEQGSLPPLLGVLDREEVEREFAGRGVKACHVNAVYTHLFRRGGALGEVPGLPRPARDILRDTFRLTTSRVLRAQETESGGGMKLEVELQDGLRVETVIIRHAHRSTGGRRNTVCVSSQVGCGMGCKFCATGTMGLRRNLTTAEILEQVWHCMQVGPVRNVVFMGMGEPLDNYPAVLSALRQLVNNNMFGLKASSVTVSTVGVLEGMRALAVDCPRVNLALSLHAAQHGLRTSIIPSAIRYTMQDLTDTIHFYHSQTGKMIMMEYTLIGGVNDSPEHARELGEFCRDIKCMVNLIPYNPTEVGTRHGYQIPTDKAVEAFEDALKTFDMRVKVRWSTTGGREVDGACGQMVLKQ